MYDGSANSPAPPTCQTNKQTNRGHKTPYRRTNSHRTGNRGTLERHAEAKQTWKSSRAEGGGPGIGRELEDLVRNATLQGDADRLGEVGSQGRGGPRGERVVVLCELAAPRPLRDLVEELDGDGGHGPKDLVDERDDDVALDDVELGNYNSNQLPTDLSAIAQEDDYSQKQDIGLEDPLKDDFIEPLKNNFTLEDPEEAFGSNDARVDKASEELKSFDAFL